MSMLYRPSPAHALRQALDLTERELHVELNALEKSGLVLRNSENGHLAAASAKARLLMGRRGLRNLRNLEEKEGGDGEATPFLLSLERLWLKDLRGGAESLSGLLEQFLRRGHSAGALVCLDVLLGRLRGWRFLGRPHEENGYYLSTVQAVLGISLYMTRRLREIDELLSTALKVADLLGDRRSSLQLRLMRACHALIVGDPHAQSRQPAPAPFPPPAPEALMDALIAEIMELGDPDIMASTAYGIGLRHNARGEFQQAVEALWNDDPDISDIKSRYFGGLGLLALTDSACCLGQFHLALGRIVCQINQLRSHGAQFATKRARIQAAGILLRAGLAEAALEMMSDAFSCCDNSAEPRLAVWGYRNLALYHFQRGNLDAAYRMLLTGVELALKYGLRRSYIAFQYSLDMLWAFEAAGLPELPGNYSLEAVLRQLLASPNPQWQGLALRIRARQLLAKGGKAETALSWLEDSLQRLQLAGNPVESARSGLALAEVLRSLGRLEEAEKIHDLSGLTLAEFHQFDCPPSHQGSRAGIEAPNGEGCLRRCAEGLAALPAWTSLTAQVRALVDNALKSFQFERAAIFTSDGQSGISELAARHFSAAELAGPGFRPHWKRLARCLETQKPLVAQTQSGAWLYLPLLASGERQCALLAHCAFLTANILRQDKLFFEELRRLLEIELRLAFRLQRNIEASRKEDNQRAREATLRLGRDGNIHYGPSMFEVLAKADKAAATDAAVLVLGETGVGKEELARRMHADGEFSGPFVAVHPASIPEQLFESELFGHEKGAFTGAHKQKIGLLELADKGTLFIDEVGDIPPALQVKLLRVLQNKTFMRVGGILEIRSNFRLMSATSQDLEAKIRSGLFREDLYYRIAVVPLLIPPLRERPEDVGPLAEMFRSRFCARYKRNLPSLTTRDLAELRAYEWPGNIRELKSCMERAVILYDGNPIASFLRNPALKSCNGSQTPADARVTTAAAMTPEMAAEALETGQELFEGLPTLQELQRSYIGHVLAHTRGKIDGRGGALEILGMKRSSLYAKIREYGLDKATMLYGREREHI